MVDPAVTLYLMAPQMRRTDPRSADVVVERCPTHLPPQWRAVPLEGRMLKVGSFAKAIVSALSAGTAALVTAMSDSAIETGEWVTVALAVLGALGITYVVPNARQSDLSQR